MEMGKERVGYREILRQAQFMKMTLANGINRLGDSIDVLAYTYIVYQVTKSPAWTALAFGLNQLPTMLLQPMAGALVERQNKKAIMVLADVLRAMLALGFCLLFLAGQLTAPALAVYTLLVSSVEAFRVPCGKAILPQLLDEQHYAHGMSLNGALSTAAELVGTGAAGLVIALWGAQTAIAIDVAAFALSALLQLWLRVRPVASPVEEREPLGRMLGAGFRYVVDHRTIRNLALVMVVMNMCLAPLNSFLAVIVEEILGQGSQLMSVINVAISVGMLLGSVAYPLLAKRMGLRQLIVRFAPGIGLSFLCVPLLGRVQDAMGVYALSALLFLILGLSMSISSSGVSVEVMRAVEPDFLARTTAILGAAATASLPLTSFVLSALCRVASVSQLLIASGALLLVFLAALALLRVELERPRSACPVGDAQNADPSVG